MGFLGFGKKKKAADPADTEQKIMNQEPPADQPEDSVMSGAGIDSDELDQLYQMGLDCQDEGNDAAAFQYLKKAAEGGHVLAQFTLGTIYERGSDAVYQDAGQAIYWYSLAAEKGDPGAQFNLGYLFLQSSEKYDEGIAWMTKAADQGDEAAQEYLASLASETERKQKMADRHKENIAAAKRLLGRKQLFLLLSRATNRPFILEEGDYYVLLYGDRESAAAKCTELEAQGLDCMISIVNKNGYLAALGSFYGLGCNAVRFHDEESSFDVLLYDIVRVSRKNQGGKKPVENPRLVRSMLLSRQEAFKKARNIEPDETLVRRYQDDIMTMLFQEKVELLRPYILVEKDGEQIRAPFLFKRDVKDAPVRAVLFSSDETFARFKQNNPQLRRRVITADDLKDIPLPAEVKSFIIDPNSANLLVNVTKNKA